jgi:hypothetical protein
VRAGLQVIFWLKSAHFLQLAHVWAGATVKIAQELGISLSGRMAYCRFTPGVGRIT